MEELYLPPHPPAGSKKMNKAKVWTAFVLMPIRIEFPFYANPVPDPILTFTRVEKSF
jgi:hypothetical protein